MDPKYGLDADILRTFYETTKQKITDGRSVAKIEGKIAVGDIVYPVGSDRAGEIIVESGQKITKNGGRNDLQFRPEDGRDHGAAGDAAVAQCAGRRRHLEPRRSAAADLPAAASRQSAAIGKGQGPVPRKVLRHESLPLGPRRPLPHQPQAGPHRAGRRNGAAAGRPDQRGQVFDASDHRRRRCACRRHRSLGQSPFAHDRRAGVRRNAQGLLEAPPHRAGADEPQGHRGHDAAQPHQSQEHFGGDRVFLRPRRAVASRRSDESALDAHARAAAVGPRPGRFESQAGRLRSARRAHFALRPHLPDRDAGRHEHRPDFQPGHVRGGR